MIHCNKINKSILSIINHCNINRSIIIYQNYTTLNNIVPPTTTIIPPNQQVLNKSNNIHQNNPIKPIVTPPITPITSPPIITPITPPSITPPPPPITPPPITTVLPIPTLNGKLVTLRPLTRNDRDSLVEAAKDGELYNFKLTIVPSESTIDKYLDIALAPNNSMMPFVIVENQSGRIIGTTRYWKVDVNHRKLEIGHTWLSKSKQRSGINTECKYLLLKYAFEDLNSIRVQFTTDELNEKSRDAILRIGAKLEGLVRNERVMPDGRIRNSLRFSIINSEWSSVKFNLENMLNKNYTTNK